MATTLRSQAFFCGNLQNGIDESKIDTSVWETVIEDRYTYDFLCSYFHKSHVDAMIQAQGQIRPGFLDDVRHYRTKIGKTLPLSVFNENSGELKVIDAYSLGMSYLHIYLFPLGITLYAIEIDDSGSELNDLTLAHSVIRELPSRWNQFNVEFTEALEPLLNLIPEGSLAATRGNKLKLFQILLVDQNDWTDTHLYEIGCCIPVDIVESDHRLAPSKQYYDSIMAENCVAPFKTWKSLSLTDTYTALFKSANVMDEALWEEEKQKWTGSYYRFIFLRVLVQKTFLSTHNVQYRQNVSNANIVRDMARMEQYYFYDNISYNFLPDLINKQMEKGMAINDEKAELSRQIKERDNKNYNTLTGILSVFAIFSICLDIYNLISMLSGTRSLAFLSVISIISVLCIIVIVIRLIRRR